MGIRAEAFDARAGSLRLRLPFHQQLQRSSERPEIHGGVIAALIDVAGAYAIGIQLGSGPPTVDLRVDYLRFAVGCDLVASARTVKLGQLLGRVDVEVRAGDELVATGRAAYAVGAAAPREQGG